MQPTPSTKNILIAPLDWGLGHATRSIPIIRFCIESGYSVVIATSGRSLELLKVEFPGLTFINLPSYNIYYQEKGSFVLNIIRQLGKVFMGIRREHRAVKKIIRDHHIGLIISDNRYGVYSKKIYSIIISHQMMVKLPGMKFTEPVVYEWLKIRHNRFHEIWIPDVAGDINISGDLSHRYRPVRKAKFIGVLTRFHQPAVMPPKIHDVLLILSGPEPQRTIFEQLVFNQLKNSDLKYVIVKGVSEQFTDENIGAHGRLISYLTAGELFQFILESEIIISRGGYSTLMDLALLGKRCIFIPTPGQPEQEYLVDELAEKGMVYTTSQDAFNLHHAIEEVKKIKPFLIEVDPDEFKKHLINALQKLK